MLRRTKKQNVILVGLLLLLVSGGVFWFAYYAQGVTRTWDGGGTDGTCGGGAGDGNKWTCALNWTGDTVPTSSDTAVFDGTSTKNATINANLSGGTTPAGISINSGYSGTITQATGITISIGASGFSQAAGTFTGGNSAITINGGTFTLSAGTFTSTSGILTFDYGSGSSNTTLLTVSGGTYNHNNGTVTFTSDPCGSPTFTIDVVGSLTLYNVTENLINTYCGQSILTTASGDTIIVANNFTHTDGVLNGTWEVQGNVTIGAGANGGIGTLTYTGTGAKTYTYSAGGTGPHLRVNNAGVTVSAAGGTTDLKTDLFSLLAGTFTAPSGTMTIGRSTSGNETIFTVSGGVFSNNNGTVSFSPNGNCASPTFTVDVVTSLTFNNVISNATNSCGGYAKLSTASGDTIIAANNFTQTSGYIDGTWEVQGNVVIGAAASGGIGTLTYTGTGAKTYTYSAGGTGPHLRVNNAGVSVSPTGGTTDLKVSLFSLLAGTFTAPSGTFMVGRDTTSETSFTISGGTFNHNSGTVSFRNIIGCLGAQTFTIDVQSTLLLYNVEIYGYTTVCGGNVSFTTASGDTIIATGNFTQTDGVLLGTWEVKGNTTIATTADGGTATLSFTGTGDQTYTDQGGNEPDGNITINKPVGTAVNLASNADWNAASQTTTITSGILNIGAYNLYTGGTLTVGSSGVLHDYSTGDLILGGNVSNSGIIRLESNGTCGYTDNISITSSTGGVQRTWSGSGVYTLWDTSIQDQGGTAKIQVNSGTSVSGNGTNFVFSSACNLANNTSSLTSGLVGYWPMEENSGTSTADMSGNGNTGTLNNGPTWGTGQIGQGVSFDGNSQYIQTTSSVTLNPSVITVSAWAKPSALSGNENIVARFGDSGGNDSYILRAEGTTARFHVFVSGSWYNAMSSTTLSQNTWYHLTGTYDGSTIRIYVNGVEVGNTPHAGSIASSTSAVRIGSGGAAVSGEKFPGSIDEVRIYNRALTAAEVQQLYYNVRPSSTAIPSGKFQITNSKLKLP